MLEGAKKKLEAIEIMKLRTYKMAKGIAGNVILLPRDAMKVVNKH